MAELLWCSIRAATTGIDMIARPGKPSLDYCGSLDAQNAEMNMSDRPLTGRGSRPCHKLYFNDKLPSLKKGLQCHASQFAKFFWCWLWQLSP